MARAFDRPTLWIFCGPNGCGDNSGATPRRIGHKDADGATAIDPSAPADMIAALTTAPRD